jgi:hypothetical protein
MLKDAAIRMFNGITLPFRGPQIDGLPKRRGLDIDRHNVPYHSAK